jgi:glucose/arabinose dehydrogenase
VANYSGEIFRLIDSDNDGLEDTATLFCRVTDDGLRSPTTIAFHGRELYVGTTQEIRAYEDVDGDGKADRSRTVLKLPYSNDPQDWTFGLCFAPDGSLYFSLSTDSYNPNPPPDPAGWRGSLLRVSPDVSSP